MPRHPNTAASRSTFVSRSIVSYAQDYLPVIRTAVSSTATRVGVADGGSPTLLVNRCTQFPTVPYDRFTPRSSRIAVVSLSERPAAWSRTANVLTGVAVRSRCQHSRVAVSNVSLSRSASCIDTNRYDLLVSQTSLTIQCREAEYIKITI